MTAHRAPSLCWSWNAHMGRMELTSEDRLAIGTAATIGSAVDTVQLENASFSLSFEAKVSTAPRTPHLSFPYHFFFFSPCVLSFSAKIFSGVLQRAVELFMDVGKFLSISFEI